MVAPLFGQIKTNATKGVQDQVDLVDSLAMTHLPTPVDVFYHRETPPMASGSLRYTMPDRDAETPVSYCAAKDHSFGRRFAWLAFYQLRWVGAPCTPHWRPIAALVVSRR